MENKLVGMKELKQRGITQGVIKENDIIAIPIYYEGAGVAQLAGTLDPATGPTYLMLDTEEEIIYNTNCPYKIIETFRGYYTNGRALTLTDIYVLKLKTEEN